MKHYKKFNLSILYQYFWELVENVQQNFAIYFLVFFFNHSINLYILFDTKQFVPLLFLTLEIGLISFIMSLLICDSLGKYRKLIASGIFELVIFLNGFYFLKYNDFLMSIPLMIIFCGVAIFMFFIQSKCLKYVVTLVLGIIWGIDLFSLINYKTPMNSTMITFILETNYWEIYEYIVTFINLPMVLSILGIFSLLLFFYKHLRLSVQYRGIVAKVLLIFIPTGMAVIFSPCFEVDYTNSYRENIPIVRFFSSTIVAMERRAAYEDFALQENDTSIIVENNAKIKNVVIILGESASRNHMGIYGYHLNTTPYANKLLESGNLKCFKDVVSPYETTTFAMSKLFTFSNYEFADNDDYLHENLIDVAKQAGYKTYWLSNQEFSSLFGNIEMHLSKRSDTKIFTRYRGSEQMNLAAYDEELLPLVDESIRDNVDKKFIVIHLMGSHYTFRYRYPENYNTFNGSDILLDRTPEKRQIIAEYDNSILYTDYIINEIFKKFQNEDTLMIYLSDHAEDVYKSRDRIVRSNGTVNKHTVEIPFFILTSDGFKQRYPDKFDKISSSVHRPYMTDDFIHTVLDLMEIKTAKFEEKRSVINDNYDMFRKRITCDKNYDIELK